MSAPPASLCGLVLAAGAGTRFGRPKALAREPDGTPWVLLAVRMLRDAGCDLVLVALGASADEARLLVPENAEVIVVRDWSGGLSATLRAGIDAASATGAAGLLVTPVDTPAAPSAAATRVCRAAVAAASVEGALARAVYSGSPGHPVLIGREHWAALRDGLSGDSGAGPYLASHAALEVECGDLWSGADVDADVR